MVTLRTIPILTRQIAFKHIGLAYGKEVFAFKGV